MSPLMSDSKYSFFFLNTKKLQGEFIFVKLSNAEFVNTIHHLPVRFLCLNKNL